MLAMLGLVATASRRAIMRFFIHSAVAILLLLPAVSWAQRTPNPAEAREGTSPIRTRVEPLQTVDQQAPEAAVDVGVPKEGDAAPPLDQSIAADRLPGKGPPPRRPGIFQSRRYAQFQVLGSGIRDFYYVRQDILLQFSDGRSTGLKQVLNGGNYGPNPVGGTVSVVAGANYVFFPTCRGGISWATHRLAQVPAGQTKGQVALSCLR
jgi:hypothetical protein